MASERPVLVVGAGPVGLTAAAFLAHFGTPVRIIDSNSAPTNLSKALVLWRRSIATLDPLIPHEHWLAVGAPVQGAYFGDEGASVAHVDVSNPTNISEDVQKRDGKVHVLPAGYMVSQADVEAALVGVLQHNFNITVQRNTSLASFKVSDDAECVNCTLESGDSEQQEQIEASYLVACDGARSAVRKQLGLSFQGATLDQRWLLADAKFVVQDGINPKQPQQEVERVPLRDALFLCTSSVGIVGTIPVAGREGVVRILWNCDSLGPAEPTLDHFQQLLMDHTRLQIKLTDAIWISEFRINERQVESYVHAGGRVLLAGDAAHVHSPAGGQGMNTGIQDAANLAWKLAMVIAGEAAAGQQLLDTYQEERWPVGASVIRRTGMLLRTNALRNYWVRMVRLLALRVVTAVPAIRQRMVSALAEDDVAYPHSSLNVLDQTFSSATTTSHSSVSTSVPYKEASAAARAVWGSCKPGHAFPDVSVKIEGSARSAGDLLRGMPGCFGTLVVLAAREDTTGGSSSQSKMQDSAQHNWPTHWGHWQLNRADIHEQQGAQVQKVPGAVDSWGLLRAATAIPGTVGVLVRPDGIVAVVGSPEIVSSWLKRHVKVAMSAAG